MPDLYIIAGCNGAGKTTASYTILPEVLNCREFVNADNIAVGLSPFYPEGVALEAGRIMLSRIKELLKEESSFAIETTLATKSYVSLIRDVRNRGYKVTLLFFWLKSPEKAFERVASRVREGGHNIPQAVIERRYYRGMYNLINLYIPVVDDWVVVNNMLLPPEVIAQFSPELGNTIIIDDIWNTILKQRKYDS